MKPLKRKVPDPPASSEPDLLDERNAAAFLGVSVKRIHALRRRGEIPAIRLGWRRWYFRSDDLMAFVEKSAAKDAPGDTDDDGKPRLKRSAAAETSPHSERQNDDGVNSVPLVRMANAILSSAIDAGASDIHIEPGAKDVVVRCRIDGRLERILSVPKHIQPPLINRYKVMANIPPYQRHLPQTGCIPLLHSNRKYEARVSSVPGLFGETIVMHIADEERVRTGLASLGMTPEIQERLKHLLSTSEGLVLFAGSPGSGVTTTVHSAIFEQRDSERSIHMLEETIEYRQPEATQTALAHDRRMEPREWLETTLRQNPDLLFLGDIRDPESAALAVDAALSGKLTIVTIPAMDAVDALRRLIDFGITPEQAVRCLSGVMAQRLLLRVCPECAESYTISASDFAGFGYDPRSDEEITVRRGAGCDACRNHGRKGRIAVFELLEIDETIAGHLRRGAPQSDLYAAAIAGGMKPMRDDAFAKVLSGEIPLDEARRLTATRFGRLL